MQRRRLAEPSHELRHAAQHALRRQGHIRKGRDTLWNAATTSHEAIDGKVCGAAGSTVCFAFAPSHTGWTSCRAQHLTHTTQHTAAHEQSARDTRHAPPDAMDALRCAVPRWVVLSALRRLRTAVARWSASLRRGTARRTTPRTPLLRRNAGRPPGERPVRGGQCADTTDMIRRRQWRAATMAGQAALRARPASIRMRARDTPS